MTAFDKMVIEVANRLSKSLKAAMDVIRLRRVRGWSTFPHVTMKVSPNAKMRTRTSSE